MTILKYILPLIFVLLSSTNFAHTNITLRPDDLSPKAMKFVPHKRALALNIPYGKIKEIRKLIEAEEDLTLKFYKGWSAKGEAHVTVITPPEYNKLKKYVTMYEINHLSLQQNIQNADLEIYAIGKGEKNIHHKKEATYFVIVESLKLRKIRRLIFELYVSRGGNPQMFDPAWFFPHITIGFTKRDLHESDGVFKNLKHAFDAGYTLE